jgi:hypothetical protein
MSISLHGLTETPAPGERGEEGLSVRSILCGADTDEPSQSPETGREKEFTERDRGADRAPE